VGRDAAWGLPLLWYMYTRGGCAERGLLAHYLGVDLAAVRRMLWGLRRRGLVSFDGGSACVTKAGVRRVGDFFYAARKRGKFSFLSPSLLVYVVVRAKGARAHVVPLELACRVCSEAASSLSAGPRRVASRLGVASKTVSYVLKALDVLGCPSSVCPLSCCGAQGVGGKS